MIEKTAPFIIAVLVFGYAGLVSAGAQQDRTGAQTTASTASASEQTSAAQGSPSDVDLSITAHVTARELRFEVVPEPKVEFTGKPKRTTVWEAERQNLPRPVEPGITYRNIGIQLKITSVFADIDRIVAEALGEVPASDDAPPTPQPQQAPQPQQSPQPAPPSTPSPSTPSAQPPQPIQTKSEGSPL